jgi:hypothetical protein
MRIFLTHGRDEDAVARVRQWFTRNHADIELVLFAPQLGDPIPTSIETSAAAADAAIVLATPDDLGALRGSEAPQRGRARQNVWIELGFFWARLGRHRTLLLLRRGEHGPPEIPTNLAGLTYAEFEQSLAEASPRLQQFVTNIRSMPAEGLTEVMAVSAAFEDRDREWRHIRAAARRELWVVGFAMRSQRRWLGFDLAQLRQHSDLRLIYQVVDPEFAQQNRRALATMHRADAVEDNRSFFPALLRELERHPDVADRVELQLHAGVMPFSALVADPPAFGSEMLVQPFVPRPSESASAHPRLQLRRRSADGAYGVYWDAVSRAAEEATESRRTGVGAAAVRRLLGNSTD